MSEPTNWTELPHWVVMAREPFSEPRCVAHYWARAEAEDHARRRRAPGVRTWVQRTS